jgi:hypothetical protein
MAGPEEKKTGGTAFDGEVVLSIGADRSAAESLKQNLKVRALFVPTSVTYPPRSRIRVKIVGTDPARPAELIAEVVFVSPQGLGLQILELDPTNETLLDKILGPSTPATSPAPNPVVAAPPPVQATAPPPVQPAAATPLQPASPAPKPAAAPRIAVPLTGTLTSELPPLILQMHHKEAMAGSPQETEIPIDTALGMFLRLNRDRFTGCLIVDTEDKVTTEIFFRDGHVVGGHHEPEIETASLGYALRKAGKLPDADYREIQRKRAETMEAEVKLLSLLVDGAALQKGWRVMIFQNVGRCLAAKKSKYRLEEGAHVLSRTLPLPVQLHRVLYRAIVEAGGSYSNEELLAGLEPYLNFYVSKKEKLPFDSQQLRLDDKELRFLNVTLVTPTRLRTIFSVSALSKSGTLRALYAFYFLRCLAFATNYQPPEKEFLPHLNRVWIEISHANHFEVVQVHWTIIGPAIEAAYQRTKKEWEEIRKNYHAKPEYTAIIDKIIGRIDESYRFISDNDRRREYRDSIIEPMMRQFSAELLSQHTRTYLLRGDKKQARAYIEMAIDLAPGNAEYRQLLRDSGG